MSQGTVSGVDQPTRANAASVGLAWGASGGPAPGDLFEKLGIESRNAATVRALEVLSSQSAK